MIAFIEKLNSEVLRSIERIESRDTDVLKKSLEASRVLGEAFDRLKQYIIGYRFQNDDEEIKFFKEIKPRLFLPSDLLPQALQYRDEPSGRKYRGTT